MCNTVTPLERIAVALLPHLAMERANDRPLTPRRQHDNACTVADALNYRGCHASSYQHQGLSMIPRLFAVFLMACVPPLIAQKQQPEQPVYGRVDAAPGGGYQLHGTGISLASSVLNLADLTLQGNLLLHVVPEDSGDP